MSELAEKCRNFTKLAENWRKFYILGCEFGDKSDVCKDVEAKDCYTMESSCCETCPRLVSRNYDELREYLALNTKSLLSNLVGTVSIF